MTITEAYEKGYRDGEHDGYFSTSIERGIEPNAYCPPEEEQPERPKGEWKRYSIEHADENSIETWYECSKCGEDSEYPWNFCHFCGAEMKGGE